MKYQLGKASPGEPGATRSFKSRRQFLGTAAAAMAGAMATLTGCDRSGVEAFLQHNFRELTKDDIKQVIARLEQEARRKYGKAIHIGTEPPIPGVLFGYALDLSRCIGCRRCAKACVKENNQSRDPQIEWIRVLQMDKEEGVDITHADPYYNPDLVPQEGHFYMPVQCHQCRNAPCTKVCPVGATWQEKDGIVVVDYNWCIGCRYCMAACPYGARRFNWGDPMVPADELNPVTHYLGNRPRPRGWWRSAPSASSGSGTGSTRPAWRSAPPAPGNSATSWTPRARSATSSKTSGSSSSRKS